MEVFRSAMVAVSLVMASRMARVAGSWVGAEEVLSRGSDGVS